MAVPALLLLENEEAFHGVGMGHEGMAHGIMAACTLIAGFPDLLTDPAYSGKIVCFTHPHIGNAGVVPDELQSDKPAAKAVVAREICKTMANRLGVETIDAFLKRHQIPAIVDVDTRSITQVVTRLGTVRAVLGCGEYANAALLAKEFAKDDDTWKTPMPGVQEPGAWLTGAAVQRHRVVVYDLGVKKGFLRRLTAMGCSVKIVPADYPVAQVLADKPNGVVISAGPGIPATWPGTVAIAKELLGKMPLWGIGVGAGILAAAAGARIVADGKIHNGVYPVGRIGSPRGEMTIQCHDFRIDASSLENAGLVQTHRNLNDDSVEGFKCDARRLLGVLFHPEAEPGPRDSLYMFDRFYAMIRK